MKQLNEVTLTEATENEVAKRDKGEINLTCVIRTVEELFVVAFAGVIRHLNTGLAENKFRKIFYIF